MPWPAESPVSGSNSSTDGLIRQLFVPGLLDPVPGLRREDRRPLPRLETLLARADRYAEPLGYAGGLFALFGIDTSAGADLPTAAVCLLADMGEAPAGFVLHADPLHLIPDRDQLLAFGLEDDPLDADEIALLVEAFNVHFDDRGVNLYASPAGRIYLLCDRAPAIQTHPLAVVIGRSLDLFLPDGEDRPRWRGLLNETQMLCHALELNREREARGRPTLGGLWFSGGGCLPPAGQGPVARLMGGGALARGLLALRAGVGEDELIVEHAPGRALVRADPAAWLQAVAELEDRMASLLRNCEALHLHPGNGTVYRWSPGFARRFWRRKRPLFDHLGVNPVVARGSSGNKGV